MTKNNNFTFWLIAIIILGLLTWGMISLATHQPTDQQTALVDETQIQNNDHFKGTESATNVLIEYSDFQCPACGSYYPLIKTLSEEMSDQVKIVYRNFPLEAIHPNAKIAAQAAEAAGLQNKFWEMHDQLFENQSSWSNEKNPLEKFLSYATSIGLDLEKFQADLDSSEVKNKLQQDKNFVNALNLNSTPTFFLNGKKISFSSYNQLKNAISEN